MKRRLTIALAILAAASAGGLLLWWLAPDAPPPLERAVAEVGDVDVERIRNELLQLKEDLRRLEESGRSVVSPDTGGPAVAREAARDQAPMTSKEVDQRLSDVHFVQARDAEWSGDTEDRLDELFSTEFPGSTLAESDCRSTFCRIVVVSDDNDAFEHLRESMPQTPPFDTEGFIHNIGDELSPTLVVYFAREGASIERCSARAEQHKPQPREIQS